MKLSRVKRICLDNEELVVKRAQSGLDVTTWIGTMSAMYPVHGIEMNARLAAQIWELDQKKLGNMYIVDADDYEKVTLISKDELEAMPALMQIDENAEERPDLEKICVINGWILLKDRTTDAGWLMREEMLAPVEGGTVTYFQMNPGRNLIGIYAGGELEAAVCCTKWQHSDLTKAVFRTIAQMYAEGIVG